MKITSIRAVPHGAHEVVTLWIDGKNTGSLVVGEGEGAQLVALLKEASAHAATKAQLAEIEARYTPLVTENDELKEKLEREIESNLCGVCAGRYPAERAVLDAAEYWAQDYEPEDMLLQPRAARKLFDAVLARRGEKP